MFEGFAAQRLPTPSGELALVRGGAGPPVLLLHGYPQTHAAWHRVAPRLASRLTVVAVDLPGYGDSAGPPPDAAHTAYSKRATAATLVGAMAALGFARFAVVGHDRGGRVGYRMALDHPERLTRLAVLDIMPTLESADRMNVRLALAEYHWLFLAQPHPLPETLIGGAPDFYLTHTLESWAGRKGAFDERALAEYRRCFRKPSVVRAACEDYRAGLSVDLEHDGGDRAVGRRISCPVLALWGGEAGDAYALDHLATWGRWAARVTGRSIACGHFLMEEAPEETASALLEFLTD